MTMPSIEGGRPLLRGRILGFPVHLDLSFVIIVGLLGWYPGISLRDMLIWLAITPVAVLVHELGHAVVARTTGARPQIALAGFGGVTSWMPEGPVSRLRSLAISLAGPGVGIVFGVGLILLYPYVAPDEASWQYVAFRTGIWTCLGWSILNLLPVLPLDGGQAMRELLPGDPEVRSLRAAYVSVVVAVLAAAAAYGLYQQGFLAVFLLFFALTNFLAIRESRGRTVSGPGGTRVPRPAGLGSATEQAVIEKLWQGDPAGARSVLADRPEGEQVDPAIHGAVLALTGDAGNAEQGRAVLSQEIARRPGDVTPIALAALSQALAHDWDALIALFQNTPREFVPPSVAARVIDEARGTGREDVANRLTYVLQPPPDPSPS
ncbi:hypothetical protein ACIB24_02620 [Spongisporangium articulatum]|uniref:Peptidase M50 domain-containing protein n=1 Tax=Spongisporangium articulatum TaxID=3362603 RepID=A0ABW8AJ02_9ACTN